jgi:putative transposase
MNVNDAVRLKALEQENNRLKRLVADLTLETIALKDVLSKKW